MTGVPATMRYSVITSAWKVFGGLEDVTVAQALRCWFLVLFGLGFVATIAAFIRFRHHRQEVEAKVGPLPTPGPILVSTLAALILLMRIGEMNRDDSIGWTSLRVLGVGLSFYSIVMLPWAIRTLGRLGVPGVAVFQDHELVTSGPFRFVRNLATQQSGAVVGNCSWHAQLDPARAVAGARCGAVYGHARGGRTPAREVRYVYDAYAARTGRFIPKALAQREPPASKHTQDKAREV